MSTRTQEDFLRAFHAERPAVTTEVFAGARAAGARTGYEALRDRVTGRRRVLDLGCGDGLLLELLAGAPGRQLAGADLSHRSLSLARRRPALSGTVLVEARAQRLPFRTGAFDACVSHMALMLMADLDQVLAELSRVLAPGALLACAIGAGGGGTAYELFTELLRRAVDGVPADRRMPALGDRRARDPESLGALLTTAGFTGEPEWETVTVDLGGPPERVWQALSGMYDLAALDTGALAALERSFLTRATTGAHLDCHFRLRVLTTRRP